ncbi:MAG: LuxR C-terminal-related transcriptional regulator [Saccharofermentans sp.]|nr:LuxR C-terminal-related transcriptional regulator [Saccharofermentans sp.]
MTTKLFISEGTVKNHITNILAKENLAHRTALAAYYLTGRRKGNQCDRCFKQK